MNRADRRAAVRAARDAQRNVNGRSTPAQPRVCVATLYATQAPPAGAFFDAWSNLLTARPVDIVEVVSVSGSLVADARNIIARRFLASDAEWLFTVDSDMDFALDTPRALIAHADPVERPIVGALAFKVRRDGSTEPTLYRLHAEPKLHLRVVRDWQRGALVQVDATGAACMVVHRSVFERLPEPWFGPAELAGEQLGEDVSFCLSARQAGIPIHVASSVDVGHVKPHAFGLADWDRQVAELDRVPTFVVVPVRGEGDAVPFFEWAPGFGGLIAIPNDDGPVNIPAKWNEGAEWAEAEARAAGVQQWNVLFVNDDVEPGEDLIAKLSRGLRSDPSHAVAYPNVHGFDGDGVVTTHSTEMAGQTLSGYCFMLRGEEGYRFDERFAWWYTDSDLERKVNAEGRKVACVLDAHVAHRNPTASTRGPLLEQARRDEALFADVWGLDPKTLFLARNPGFGAEVPA